MMMSPVMNYVRAMAGIAAAGRLVEVMRSSNAPLPVVAVDVTQHRLGQLLGRAVEDDAPARHADDAAAIGARGVQRVQVGQHGDAVAPVDVGAARPSPPWRSSDRARRSARRPADQLGLLHQRAGDGDALLLAARQGVGAVHCDSARSQPIQRADRQRPFRFA